MAQNLMSGKSGSIFSSIFLDTSLYLLSLFKKPEECDKLLFKSDKYYECIARTITLTGYSPVGTCRMGSSSSPTSVVNPELRVIGIQNLRVADASVMPSII
jgi:hypothetical protein